MLNIFLAEHLLVLYMPQCPMPLLFNNPRHHLLQNLELEHLPPITTLLPHTTVRLHPLIKPLAHHLFHPLPIMVHFHLTQPVLQLQLVPFQLFNFFLIILFNFLHFLFVWKIGSALLDHSINNGSVHGVVWLADARKALL